jgi:hypothetical protein
MSYASVIRKEKERSGSPSQHSGEHSRKKSFGNANSEVKMVVKYAHGQVVRVTLRDSSVFEGVMAAFEPGVNDNITLLYARRIDSKTPLTEKFIPEMNVSFFNLANLKIQFEKPTSHDKHESRTAFKTDTEIYVEAGNQKRSLQKFAFAPEEEAEMVSLDDEISKHKNGTQWDQYAVSISFDKS